MDNYTGPYWSDGQIQSSVEFGSSAPLSALDAESRLHDSAYAHYSDLVHRMAADSIYEANVEKLGGFAKFAGELVKYGNQTLRAGGNLLDYAKYGPLGFIVGSLINDYTLFDYMNNSEKYKKEVLAYYATDPGWEGRGGAPESNGAHVSRRFATGDQPTGKGKPISGFNEVPGRRPETYSPQGGGFNTTTPRVDTYPTQKYRVPDVYNPYPANYRRGGRRRKKRIR